MENEIANIVTGVISEKDLLNIKKDNVKECIKKSAISLFTAIPYVGSIVDKAPEIYMGYRENEFFRKFAMVVLGIKDLEHKKLSLFLEDVEKKAEDYSGNVLMGIIDRLDNIKKGIVLANLIKARANSCISTEDFFRLSTMLASIPYVDLNKLQEYQTPFYDESGVTDLLFVSGALHICIMDFNDGNKYVLSELGRKLLVYGMLINVSGEITNNKGTQTNISWERIE